MVARSVQTRLAITLSALALLVAVGDVHSQSVAGKRGLASIGDALMDYGDRQAAVNAEIELARQRAEIDREVARQMRLSEPLKPSAERPTNEETLMDSMHPQWRRIVNSPLFQSWLRTRGSEYERVCRMTRAAPALGACIDNFFATTLAAPTAPR